MKLSDAIILGDTLKTMKPNVWLADDGSCGCAFGGALLACGVNVSKFWGDMGMGSDQEVADADCVRHLWPWLTADHLHQISQLYWEVYGGRKTIEDIAVYVRSMEPQDDAYRTPVELKNEVEV